MRAKEWNLILFSFTCFAPSRENLVFSAVIEFLSNVLAAQLHVMARVLNSPARITLPFSVFTNSRESRVASNASHKR